MHTFGWKAHGKRKVADGFILHDLMNKNRMDGKPKENGKLQMASYSYMI
jgi:hypothetical protein